MELFAGFLTLICPTRIGNRRTIRYVKQNNMKAFIVEGHNWQQQIKVNNTLFDNYSDMAIEAMTQSIERINNEKAENLMEEHAGEFFEVRATMVAWGESEGSEKIVHLTEKIFGNAGWHSIADTMREQREKEDEREK